jgi:hypothetical protein
VPLFGLDPPGAPVLKSAALPGTQIGPEGSAGQGWPRQEAVGGQGGAT